jgi:DNA invertase Pin-like site-specific DNA recombinase
MERIFHKGRLMLIGYARTATVEAGGQRLQAQREELRAAGCEIIYEDIGHSGFTVDRPGLTAAFQRLRPGDTLVCSSLNRLSRSTKQLVTLDRERRARGVGLRGLQE